MAPQGDKQKGDKQKGGKQKGGKQKAGKSALDRFHGARSCSRVLCICPVTEHEPDASIQAQAR
jgi:hypothetical protein